MDALSSWSLAEQSLNAELGYYRQVDLFAHTPAEYSAWKHQQTCNEELRSVVGLVETPNQPFSFERFILELRGYSLHRYMVDHLSQAAWTFWFNSGGLLAPFDAPASPGQGGTRGIQSKPKKGGG